MKKFLFGILGICLLIGIPLIIMDLQARNHSEFSIPFGYKRVDIKLYKRDRKNEIVYQKNLKFATVVSFHIQSNSTNENYVTIKSEHNIIGNISNEDTCSIQKMPQGGYDGSTYILQPGKYTIAVNSKKSKGMIMIGFKEKKLADSIYKRLKKIDGGDLNNPPQGYEKVYSAKLSKLNCKDKTVFKVTFDHAKKVGLCVYTSASKGNLSVDYFIGKDSSYYGLITPGKNKICDRLESYSKGTYEVKLTTKDTDGEIYVFMKK